MSVVDYYLETNDTDTLSLYTLNIDAKLRHAQSIEGSATGWGTRGAWTPGSLSFFGWDERLGAGFENASCPESQRDYSMLTSRASREFADALTQAGARPDLATYHRAAADTILAQTRKDAEWTSGFGMHAAAEAINTGQLTAAEVAQLAGQLEDVTQICSLSPFNQFWILQGLGNAGLFTKARESIDMCWGGQVRLGATTFWEVFADDWTAALAPHEPVFDSDNGMTSLCHPWSSGLVQWSSENLAGIRALAPGFAQFAVTPVLQQVVARRPVYRRQAIEVAVDAVAGSYNITVPAGTVAVDVRLPLLPSVAASTLGQFWSLAVVRGADSSRVRATVVRGASGNVALRLAAPLTPGRYELSAPRFEELPSATATETETATAAALPQLEDTAFGPAQWPAVLEAEDRQTQGNWRGRYGSDGHLIFLDPTPPAPIPGPLCNFAGTWSSETAGDVIVVTQTTGQCLFI